MIRIGSTVVRFTWPTPPLYWLYAWAGLVVAGSLPTTASGVLNTLKPSASVRPLALNCTWLLITVQRG
jgi:hypothetical protein